MDLTIKDSSIARDSKTGLYWLNIGRESAGFESIYFNINWVERIFWDWIRELFDDIYKFHYAEDSIIGMSHFFWYSIVRWYLRSSGEWKTFFFREGKLSSFQIGESYKYVFYVFIYWNVHGEFHYETDFHNKNFSFVVSDWRLRLRNILFETEIYSWLVPVIKNKKIPYRDIGTDFCDNIADIFIFSDTHSHYRHEKFQELMELLHWKRLPMGKDSYIVLKIQEEAQNFFPVMKITLHLYQDSSEKMDLSQVQQLLLSYLPKYCLTSVINHPEIEKAFNKIEKVSSLEIWGLEGLINSPKSIDEYSEESQESWENLLQIQYNYYVLKTNIRKINEIIESLSESDPQYELLRERNLVNKSSIEAVLPKYEAMLTMLKNTQ